MNAALQTRLALALSTIVVLVAGLAGAGSYWQAFNEAQELQDEILRQVAATARPAVVAPPRAPERDPEAQLWVQGLTAGAPRGAGLPLPASLPEGLQTLDLAGTPYRVMVHVQDDGQRVAVAQATAVRDELARGNALHAVLPLLLLLPLLVGGCVALVRHMLQPLRELAGQADQLHESDLRPLPTAHTPRELLPFVQAVNRLLQRLAGSLDSQRRFVADAAHELRSPLAALTLQAERLADTELSADAQERLATLRAGLARSRHLLDQMLSLARSQARSSAATPAPPVALREVLLPVVAELMPLAQARGVDLGLGEVAELAVPLPEVDLSVLLRNLLDNALRHSPRGGRVDLLAWREGEQAVLYVDDEGPGIPAAERERVLQPFHRGQQASGTGAGLGLAIVQSLLERGQGRLQLLDRPDARPGLRVRVVLPL